MTYFKWIAAAALIGSTTACVDNSPYGGGSGYGYAPAPVGYYNQQPTYYGRPPVNNYYVAPQPQPQVVTQTRYVPVPVANPPRAQDRDHDGVSDRQEQDRNHNGVPDAREHN